MNYYPYLARYSKVFPKAGKTISINLQGIILNTQTAVPEPTKVLEHNEPTITEQQIMLSASRFLINLNVI
ncbi:MAG: hypothetical protein H6573_01950 [Lewinellaceae bacterium]|nr:hypothetical protein [Lewinellaceae bacterium]